MCLPAMAFPIITVNGPADSFPIINEFQALAVGWNQLETASVDVSISFMDASFGEPVTYSAYLMNQIGAGTTEANERASTTFIAMTPDPLSVSSFRLFTDTLLNPGNYYLVVGLDPTLNPDAISPEGSWGATNSPTILAAPGVTDLGQFFTDPNSVLDPYLPASVFLFDESGQNPEESVASRLLYDVQAVPEPSTFLLVLGPALGLILLKRKRA
jgi:hypothetical protein